LITVLPILADNDEELLLPPNRCAADRDLLARTEITIPASGELQLFLGFLGFE
jgi:hypothetical protein